VLTSTAVLLFFLPDGFGEGVVVGLGSILGEGDEPPLPPGIEVGSADGDEPPLPPGIEVGSADGDEPPLPPGIEVGSADGDEPPLLPGIEVGSADGDEPPPLGVEVESADGDEPLPGIDEPPLPPGIEVESADGDGLPLGSCAEEGEVPERGVPARAGMANIKPKNPEQVKNVFGEIIFE
jgi:hypothetical protein